MTIANPTPDMEPAGFEHEIVDTDLAVEHADLQLIAGAEPEPRTQWQLFRRRFVRHRLAMIGLFILIVLCVMCFGAPWIAPFPKDHQDLLADISGPSGAHWFGVDSLGRDYFTEVLYAGQLSLKIGITVAVLSTIMGAFMGAIAGFFGRGIDRAVTWVTDLFLIVPQIAILAIVLKWFGANGVTIIVVLAFTFWTYVARVVRGLVFSIKEKEFVEAARAAGASNTRIITRHILPNIIGPIMVNVSLGVAAAIITESTLSYLGFGVQRPQTSWGNLLSDGKSYLGTPNAFLLYFPGIMILVTVLAVNFVGDGLRDAFDPQSKL